MSEKKIIRVADVMTRGVKTINGMDTVREAMDILRENRMSSLVVERRNPDDEYGLVEIYDIARKIVAEDRSPDRVNVYEIMSKPVLTLPEEMNVKYAVRLLVQFQMTRALVVDHDRAPAGIVTLRDMVLTTGDLAG